MSEEWRIGEDVNDPDFDVIIQHGEDKKRTFEIEQRKRQQNQQDSQTKREHEKRDKE